MSSTPTRARKRNEALLDAVRERLEADPDSVLPTLRLLVDPEAFGDPLDDSTISLAKTLNAHRVVARLRELRAHSYTTAEVADMLGGVSRQAVSQRVAKGQLMSIQISGKGYFPEWQFVAGRPADRLAEIVAALAEKAVDTFVADGLMRHPYPEEGGSTLADLVARGEVDKVLHYIRIAGGGF